MELPIPHGVLKFVISATLNDRCTNLGFSDTSFYFQKNVQNNYYFLRQLSKNLEPKLIGLKLMECFSQEKDELVFEFAMARGKKNNYRPFFIKSIIYPDFSCLYFPEDFERKKKNSVDLFSQLIDLEVVSIKQFLNERCFAINFENNFSIVFKLFGNRSNILLFQNDEVIDLFRSQIIADKNLKISHLDRFLDQSFENFEKENYDYKKLFPTFGKLVNSYLSKVPPSEGRDLGWGELEENVKKLENPKFYLTKIEHQLTFSLLPIGEILQIYENPIEAINAFYIGFTKTDTLNKERNEVLRKLYKERKQTEAYLKDTYERLENIDSAIKNEEIGHILMANLHQIPERIEKVELFDFYRNQNISIKLKSDISPQKNAENYYRKAKNEKIEIEKLSENIEVREKLLEVLCKHINNLGNIDNIREFRNYIKKEKLKTINSNENRNKPQNSAELFKRFEYEGFEILVGKNAKNNDILTQQFAYKEDLWLHARDVAGSHVVVKYKAGKNFPVSVIEKAASLAAYFSKRRTESLVAVIFTRKKFVRKTKDLHDGQVIIEKEEVIMVEPSL